MTTALTTFVKKNLTYATALFFERGIAFLLLPLYTHALSPEEYGLYAVLFAFMAFAAFFSGLGVENGLLRYSSDSGMESSLTGTVFWAMSVSGLCLSASIFALAGPISTRLLQDVRYRHLIQLSAGILLTDTAIRYFLYRLLGLQKTRLYLRISLLRGGTAMITNLIFVVLLRRGLNGVFLSYLSSNVLVILFIFPFATGRVPLRFDAALFYKLFRFGFPVMLTSLLITLLNFFDRYLLEIRISAEAAGLYSAAYRIGFVMNMIVTAFSMGAVPFASHVLKEDPEERLVFSKLMQALFFVCVPVFLFLGLFIHDLVQFKVLGYAVINERYWKAMDIVPFILLGYVFYGFSVNFSLGLYIREKTSTMAVITLVAFGINVAANCLLIPVYAAWGAAAATFLAFFVMAALMFGVSRRVFTVPYPWGRLIGLLTLALALFVLSAFVVRLSWPVKLLSFLMFAGLQTRLLFRDVFADMLTRIRGGTA